MEEKRNQESGKQRTYNKTEIKSTEDLKHQINGGRIYLENEVNVDLTYAIRKTSEVLPSCDMILQEKCDVAFQWESSSEKGV